jgi:Tol biopolymer transport system component
MTKAMWLIALSSVPLALSGCTDGGPALGSSGVETPVGVYAAPDSPSASNGPGMYGLRQTMVGRLPETGRTDILMEDARGRHIAAILHTDQGDLIWVDGALRPQRYAEIVGVALSQDGSVCASLVKVGSRCAMVLNGRSGPPCDEVGCVEFSPDGTRCAYTARRGCLWHAVTDGKIGPGYEDVGPISFSQDSRSVAYVAHAWNGSCVVFNGARGRSFDCISDLQLSPDGRRWAYVVGGSTCCLLLDGKRLSKYSVTAGPIFSPDGRHVAFISGDDEEETVVVDGRKYAEAGKITEGHPFQERLGPLPIFSPDSRHVAYVAGREMSVVMEDGLPRYRHSYVEPESVVFSPDSSHLAYFAFNNGVRHAVVDGRHCSAYDAKSDQAPVYSRDSRHLAFIGARGEKRFAVLDGTAGPEYDEVRDIVYSPDSDHVAYAAEVGSQSGAQAFFVLAGMRSPACEIAGFACGPEPSFDSDGTLHWLGLQDGRLYRVTVSVGLSDRCQHSGQTQSCILPRRDRRTPDAGRGIWQGALVTVGS